MPTDGTTIPSNGASVPRNAQDSGFSVASNVPADHQAAQEAGRRRSERLRHRREASGLAQVSGWVPKERRAYAREVLAALSRGVNSLPPDPEQAEASAAAKAEMEAARAGEITARAELAGAKERTQALATELEETRAAGDRAGRDAQERAAEAAAALARAEVAERGREEAARELAVVRVEMEAAQGRERAAQEHADALGGELAGIKGRGGWRGMLLRLAGVR